VTKNMRDALERTYHATPNPKWVVAIGDCARDGGCFAGSYAVVGGVSEVIPVDSPHCRLPPKSNGYAARASRAAGTGGPRTPARLESVAGYRARSMAREKDCLGCRTFLVFGFATCSLSRTPRPPVELGTPGLISFNPCVLKSGNQFHERIDVGSDDAIAGFHALNGGNRKGLPDRQFWR